MPLGSLRKSPNSEPRRLLLHGGTRRIVLGGAAWLVATPLIFALACGRRTNPRETHEVAPSPLVASGSASPFDASPALSAKSLSSQHIAQDDRHEAERPQPESPQKPAEPTVILELPISAYHASVEVDDDAVYVLTGSAAYRILPGKPPQEIRLELSFGSTVTLYSYLFWSKGAVWSAPKRGGKTRRLGSVAHQPQFFSSSGGDFAWLDRSDDGRFTIQTLRGQNRHITYESPGKIDAMGMIHDWVFFVEREADHAWRIGGIPVAGGAPTFTTTRTGSPPAMLALWKDIYYFDVNTREVHAISPDFHHEQTVIRDFICSPLAVWERIYCAQLDGLFELVGKEHTPRRITDNDRRPITWIGANDKMVVWIADTGADRLAVKMSPVSHD